MRPVRRAALGAAALLAAAAGDLRGQADTVPEPSHADTVLAQDGPYDRPFIVESSLASLGGYVEGNTNWFVEDGVGDGFSMELRRFNLFFFSSVSPRLRFLAELEFEHGTEEIALETALVDFVVRPWLVARGGILLPPVGYFNQNHDSPRWDFVERPLVSTEIIPATLSEMGFGAFGRVPAGPVVVSWDAYVTNGLGPEVVGNAEGRTHLASGRGEEAAGGEGNGAPAFSGRLAARRPGLGEVGVSYYGGVYNTFRRDGVEVDERRRLHLAALDLGLSLGPVELRGEAARVALEVPPGLSEIFGDRQWGAHLDVIVPLLRPAVAGYEDAVVALAVRAERVDLNDGRFESTGASIGDEVSGLTAGLSFRPSPGTVFRTNLRWEWIHDFVGNEPARRAGVQLGFATYF